MENERAILRTQALNEGKPEKNRRKKMVEGRMRKYYETVCLLEQPYIREPEITVNDLIVEQIAKIGGENIKVRRFVRYEVGEGLAKKEEDFAAEVQAQLNK